MKTLRPNTGRSSSSTASREAAPTRLVVTSPAASSARPSAKAPTLAPLPSDPKPTPSRASAMTARATISSASAPAATVRTETLTVVEPVAKTVERERPSSPTSDDPRTLLVDRKGAADETPVAITVLPEPAAPAPAETAAPSSASPVPTKFTASQTETPPPSPSVVEPVAIQVRESKVVTQPPATSTTTSALVYEPAVERPRFYRREAPAGDEPVLVSTPAPVPTPPAASEGLTFGEGVAATAAVLGVGYGIKRLFSRKGRRR